MTKKKQKRHITEREKKWYIMGYMNGLADADRQIKLFQATNKELWKKLCKADQTHPLIGILLGRNLAERIIRSLRESKPSIHYAKRLEAAKEESEEKGMLVAVEARGGRYYARHKNPRTKKHGA